MTNKTIDMNAARRERQAPEGIVVPFGDETFTLPAELPVDVFDPFLADEFNLSGLIRDGIGRYKAETDRHKAEVARKDAGEDVTPKGPQLSKVVLDTLFDRPDLPLEVVKTIYASFELLFGADQYARFKTQRPSLEDYQFLTAALLDMYGVSLGEALASPGSSESDGATQKAISGHTTTSTSVSAGDSPDSEGGSSE